MLQALKLENAPTPAKVRSGHGATGDPADALFAGVMAKTALVSAAIPKTAATSAPSFHRGDRAKSKDLASVRPQPLEAHASPELRAIAPTGSTASKVATKASDSAKAAVQTPPPAKAEPASVTSSATVANSSSRDGAPVAEQVQAGVGATVVQTPLPDPNSQALPAETLQPALPQQPAFMEPSLAAFAPEGLKQTSVLDPGSNPPDGKLPKDSALLGFPKTADTTGATPANSAKPALTDPSQTTVSPQGLNPTSVLGQGSIPLEGNLSKDSTLLELPKTLEPTDTAPLNAVKPTLTDPSQATAVPQELKATTLGPKATLAKGTPTVDPSLSGLSQAQEAARVTPSSSSKYPLGEGLSLAKAEIQILKLNPEMAKPSQVEPPKAADVRPQAAPTEPNPARGQGQVGDKDPQAPAMKARAEAAQTSLIRPEDSAQTQRVHTSPAELLAPPIGEGIKTAPGATHAETPAVRPHPVFTQVEGSIRWILQNKSQGAELQLHPESLGRMIIQLRVEGQEVHARLWASEASSLPILREHKAFLEASLKEQGLSLGSFDLHSGARHEQAQTASQERAMGNPSGSLLPAELKQEMPNKDLNKELLASLDPHQIEVYA